MVVGLRGQVGKVPFGPKDMGSKLPNHPTSEIILACVNRLDLPSFFLKVQIIGLLNTLRVKLEASGATLGD